MLRRFPPALAGLLALLALGAGSASAMQVERVPERGWRVRLAAELGVSWRQVNLPRFRLRQPDRLSALPRERLPAGPDLELALAPSRCSLLELDVGPPADRGRPDAWRRATRCLKLAHCAPGASDADRRRATAMATAKTGSRIEIRPLVNPLLVQPGSDLPVRLYYEGEAVVGAAVEATGPGDARAAAVSDRVGIAVLTLPAPGLWRLSFAARGGRAELIFDVEKR
ncbi:MAG: DUF4198 domain-containing protein [Thermoanaerobaculia bacterium]|nr:DUF4198 domain-containing protein [Thermoanaerobaculia bacterium]